MSVFSPARFLSALSRVVLLAWFALAFAPAPRARAQMLDLNRNGTSDVWELLHSAEASTPELDSDGDGVSNRDEAVAGTDPCDAQSLLRITDYQMTPEGFRIRVAAVLGKRYQVETADGPYAGAASRWAAGPSLVARTWPMITLTAPADSPAQIFRLVVSDVDTDGDGLSDWEEYQLGLDPAAATSNGQVDASGRPLNDYRYLTGRLAGQSLASLLAGASPAIAPKVEGAELLQASVTPTGTGLTAEYYTNSSSTYVNPVNFHPTNLFLTTNDPVLDFRWSAALYPNLSNANATVRWTGQVQPQYSEVYYFETRTDDGLKLWVNDQLLIDHWQTQGTTTWTNALTLLAEVRYNIRMEYFNRGGSARASLYWYSQSQPRQIIPAVRLYPASDGAVPGAVTSPLKAFAFLGQPFSYTITGANSPLSYEATNVPPGLSFTATNGVISGIPTLAGLFQVSLSVSNVVGVSTALLDLEVIDTGTSVTREVWTLVKGTSVTNIPVWMPATLTNALGTLEGSTNSGDNYGERIRGYLTAPVTGNYRFWLAANYAAELWLSNDAEPVNKVRRAFVIKPTLPRQWNAQPAQRSAWLSLEAGQRYYIEILHKASTGSDHWSVGWLLDPTGTNLVPSGIVPGYVLSPYLPGSGSSATGTLYAANMVAQSGATSSGVGTATLRVNPDGTQAILKFDYNGLSSALVGAHIHSDPYLGQPSQILFDIDDATPESDGSYIWDLAPAGTLSTEAILEILREGKSFINLHTANYPAGEINGHFALAAGTSEFTPPPPMPAWTDDHSSSNAAARFLQQATFGSSPADIKAVRAMGYSGWMKKQFKLKPSGHLTNVLANARSDPTDRYPGTLTFNAWWQQSVRAPDQLRQRVAFALSEILVVSESGVLEGNPRALSAYYDMLLRHAFGNFRDLLEGVTLSPAMGLYLDMRRNDKGSLSAGTHPNENYAREILQLFSVGLNRMWPDGTLVLNSRGDLVPTYDQDVIIGFARVFTGWNYAQANQADHRLPTDWNPDDNYIDPMVLVPTHHEMGTKRLLDNAVLPAAQGPQADSAQVAYDGYGLADLEQALDSIFYNANVGPFLCRQLIQRLVTSHPSRDYLYRVVQKFNDNGLGVRGDMQAVIKAILLDYEARSPQMLASPTFGKQREPLLRATALARALPAPAPLKGSYKQLGNQFLTVTTSKPHRLSSSDDVSLVFSGKSGPASQVYNNVTVTSPTTFNISTPGIVAGSYDQVGTVITVTNSGHGLNAGHQLYLSFTSGGAPSGVYTVDTVPSGSTFTVTGAVAAVRAGTCAFARWTGGGFVQAGTNLTFSTVGPHGLAVGQNVYIDYPFGVGSTDGVYRVTAVPTAHQFSIRSSVAEDRVESDPLVLPLVAAPLTRSGSVTIRYGTYEMDYTDSGNSSSLSQTPLNSPTVFNFFFPDFKFQGILASAGLTTPEFQLTSDTSVVLQMNFLAGGIFNNGANTNGLSSFTGGNGAVMLDVLPWMTPAYTSDAGVPGLVEALSTVLCAGQLSPAAKAIIVSYVANSRFPYTTPTATQMRDRVRAVVHLLATSPEYTIQR